MVAGIWGKKIGMTQVFDSVNDAVVPVTVVDVSHWYVTGMKTEKRDNYSAVQVGWLAKRYQEEPISQELMRSKKKPFQVKREIRLEKDADAVKIGDSATEFAKSFQNGDKIDVVGTSRGKGFAGTIKRHNFTKAPVTHGSKQGRRPGALSWTRAHGRVMKGKKLAGHLGVERCMVKNVVLVQNKVNENILLIKGAIPGHSGSFVFIRKAKVRG